MDTLTNEEIDWKRIRLILTVGIIASLAVLASDMLLGWGKTRAGAFAGLETMFNKYRTVSTGRCVLSAVLGLIGIPAEGLCYSAVYKLIAVGSKSQASVFRIGVIGNIALGGAAHALCCGAVYFYSRQYTIDPESAFWEGLQFAAFMLLPALILYAIFLGILIFAQFRAFWREMTPYPKWCAVFSIAAGIIFFAALKSLGGAPLFEGLAAGSISLGNLLMFGGLLAMSKKAETGNF